MAEEESMRAVPQSDLDLNLMITDAVWGKAEVSPELKSRLNQYYSTKDEKGKEKITIQSLWGLLGYYTRDMRLANLSKWDGELAYVSYYIDLAGDFLQAGMLEPFLISLSRAATRLELSQSKGGFLRKTMNTFRREDIKGEINPPKKSLFGGQKKQTEGF